jgi:hypothetical protein
MYPTRRSLLLFAAAFAVSLAHADISKPDLSKYSDATIWKLHNRTATDVPDRNQALRLDARENDGIAWLVGSDFRDGTIEFDVRGANKPGQSFVGIALRGADNKTYDSIYFRPFNFKQPDPARRARAVQYVSMPDHPWQVLRENHPGKYEAAISPIPDPDGWFHARVVIANGKISVFVNDATAPCLVVDELTRRTGGMIGLWVGNGSSGDFANVTLTSASN